ncbi:hypothetical protein GAP32_463 [Cronobacter phage vB_CsaM_GAP32]|uniref:Uncharacterized protein n=1 Tax=Cronobacter phage vB_CsaM_GAP32 TaxID=1141136 RepID=K4F6M4_9CAUD|nr:hypothetical protein GAP32_463 [Cronobacter phage vB_CsaM_GAP32]AFC21921.1 hypothetical protein GAP32_463 [Cronobacter phage vB_CsaM_GAP32]
MTGTLVVVENFEIEFGVEQKRLFKAFENIETFENYCLNNGIRILKGAFGTKYYDDTYGYIVNHVELISES